jgi:hypothetical protein
VRACPEYLLKLSKCESPFQKACLIPYIAHAIYLLQVEQLTAEQALQVEPPPIGVDAPELSFEKEAKGESIRLALW